MKTRDELYRGEAADLLNTIATYHTILYDQALLLSPKKQDTTKTLIRNLIRQKRLYYDKEKNLLCDCPESAPEMDAGLIASLWVLLDFKQSVLYHTSGDFPVKITFFANNEVYEIIYVSQEQEALINHVFASKSIQEEPAKRLVILEAKDQASKLCIPTTIAYCIVVDDTVKYYQKGGTAIE